MTVADYHEFILSRAQSAADCGFKARFIPGDAFDFQRHLIEWSTLKGRSSIFADCGLGKTLMQLAWAQNVIEETNRPVMIATPIAVGQQTIAEAERFGMRARRTRDGVMDDEACIWVTNYEQLHKYDPMRFGGFVGDESSGIKDFKSERKKDVVEFTRRMPYRLLCTATAAPNDFWELGTSSEALGYLGFRDMITTFFKQETSKDQHGWGRTKYRFRGHAENPFWAWVCSWARSLRRPSDLGFDDSRFVLPELVEDHVIVEPKSALGGRLFTMAARDMQEERAERRHTLQERCEIAAGLALESEYPASIWCELNPEGDLLEKLIPESVQVKGSMSDDAKEEALLAFSAGQIKRIIIKPKIGAWGLNWQHCNRVICFPSHSYEQYYQLVRRCYRFGQKRPVRVTSIVSEGEVNILQSQTRKKAQAEAMFANIVAHMQDAMRLVSTDFFHEQEELPKWL